MLARKVLVGSQHNCPGLPVLVIHHIVEARCVETRDSVRNSVYGGLECVVGLALQWQSKRCQSVVGVQTSMYMVETVVESPVEPRRQYAMLALGRTRHVHAELGLILLYYTGETRRHDEEGRMVTLEQGQSFGSKYAAHLRGEMEITNRRREHSPPKTYVLMVTSTGSIPYFCVTR